MKRILFHLSVLLMITLSSCMRDRDEKRYDPFDETCQAASLHGLTAEIDGEVSYTLLEDTAVYNRYILCLQDCQENHPDDLNCNSDCLAEAGLLTQGALFSLSVRFINTTSSTVTYTIVPGTWFLPGSDEYQPMIIVVEVVIVVPAYTTVTQIIPVFCLASSKSAPDGESEYTLCEIVTSECLSEIVAILQAKDMENLSMMQIARVQEIIWACSEGEEVDFDYLDDLPDRKR